MLLSCISEALIFLNLNSKHPTKPGIVFSILMFSELHLSVRFGVIQTQESSSPATVKTENKEQGHKVQLDPKITFT